MIGEDNSRKDSEHASNGLEVMPIADQAYPIAGLIGEIGHESSETDPEEHHLVGLPYECHVLLLTVFAEPNVILAVWWFGVDEVVVAALHIFLISSGLWLGLSVCHN